MIVFMSPISRVATGFLIALVTVRINHGFDLLVDAVGWLIATAALSRLEATLDPVFSTAKTFCAITCVVSLADVVGFTENLLIGLVYTILQAVSVLLVATAIIRRAEAHGDASTATKFNALRVLVAVITALTVLLAIGGTSVTFGLVSAPAGGTGVLGLIAVAVAVIAIIWFFALFYRAARLPYLRPPAPLPPNSA
jgi:hypothetical protein